jgi:hypothetical protein
MNEIDHFKVFVLYSCDVQMRSYFVHLITQW